MTATARHSGLALAAALLLGGCINLGGKAPPPTMLVLSPESSLPAGTYQTGAPKDALIVLIPEVPRMLDTNRVPVRVDNANVAYVKDAIWSDKPARLMQQLLMETISAKNSRFVLNEVEAGGKAENFLSGSLHEFGVDATALQAIVVYDAVKLRKGQVVEKRRFEAREAIGAIEPRAAGTALNRAANRVAGDVADWLVSR